MSVIDKTKTLSTPIGSSTEFKRNTTSSINDSIFLQNQVIIPTENIYKIRLLNENGLTGSIIIFCRNTINDNNISEIFSNSEIQEMKTQNIPIFYSNEVLHKDDSISTIKKKIIYELNKHSVSVAYEEIYLFAATPTKINSMYDFLADSKKHFIMDHLQQLFSNMKSYYL